MNNFLNLIFEIGLYHYLAFAIILFFIGLFGVVISKNTIKALISLEFMLCSVNVNFIAFASFFDNELINGFVFSLFIIAMGAVETAILLAIFYVMFKEKQSANIEDYKELRG